MREPSAKSRERQGVAAHASRVADRLGRDNVRAFAVAGAVGVFLALSGAFGTMSLPLPMRLFYWLTLMFGGSVMGVLLGPFMARRPKIGENRVIAWAVIAAVITVPATIFVWGFTGLVFGGRSLESLPYFFGATGTISAAMTALTMIVNTPGPATHAPPTGAPPSRVRFLERLPPKLMGAVIHAVQSEDHYLRLHTSKGSDLILVRLSDAVAELEGIEGAQVHRSWWVAREAVTEVRRDNGRVTLVLPGGVEAPVSRPNVKALKDAGWI